MRSDQEFLAGIWNRIANLETEELEKTAARRRNRALRRRGVALAGGLLLMMVLFVFADGYRLLMDVTGGLGQYGLAGLVLLGGYLADSPRANSETKGLTDQ